MTAIFITVWVLMSGPNTVPNIASEMACHDLARALKVENSYRCASYPGVVGTTDRAVCVPRNGQ